MSGQPCLRAASLWRVAYPFAMPGSSALENTRALTAGLSTHLAELQRMRKGEAPQLHVICSTILSALLVDSDVLAAELAIGVRSKTKGWPQPMIVSAYECASWGYALRYLASRRCDGDVVISIVDVDIHNFTHWERHSAWGASGFGVTSMWLDLAPTVADCIRAGAARSANGLMELGRAIVEFNGTVPAGVAVHAPFFPTATRSMLERVTTGVILAPDRHPQYGHCFGSDPWISLITDLMERGDAAADDTVVLCSLALNGYFAIAGLKVADDVAVDSRSWPRRAITSSREQDTSHA